MKSTGEQTNVEVSTVDPFVTNVVSSLFYCHFLCFLLSTEITGTKQWALQCLVMMHCFVQYQFIQFCRTLRNDIDIPQT